MPFLRRDPSSSGRRGRRAGAAPALALGVALLAVLAACAPGAEPAPPVVSELPAPSIPSPSVSPTPTPSPTPTFDRAAFSIDDPASLWVVSNKRRPLQPTDYVPADLVPVPVPFTNAPSLRQEAADAAVAVVQAAREEAGLELISLSAYRSYGVQVAVYNGVVAQQGQEAADLVSARPGHSEHQTGLAIDFGSQPQVCSLQPCFGETAHGVWLAENAHRFGFVLRYPSGATPVTGFSYEPWHFRYVGVALAAEMRATGVATLEEFFGLEAAPDYG